MNNLNIIYKVNSASEGEIFSHLNNCDVNYIPPLSKSVNIEEYSKKIFEKAYRFEAWLDEILVGLVAIYLNDKVNFRGYITNVSVLKEYTGLGIASKLLVNSVDCAKKMNFNEILLEVNKYNTLAIILYNKLKFTRMSVKGDSLVMRI